MYLDVSTLKAILLYSGDSNLIQCLGRFPPFGSSSVVNSFPGSSDSNCNTVASYVCVCEFTI